MKQSTARVVFLVGMTLVLVASIVFRMIGPHLDFATLFGGGEPQPVSVLLISPDSLRADRLPAWEQLIGDPEPAPTPNLDRLAARGILYDNAWSTAPWTAPSMVSVMTGLYPPAHGIAYRDDTTPPGLPTLPTRASSMRMARSACTPL